MKTDLKVELFLIHQTYFPDNHGTTTVVQTERPIDAGPGGLQKTMLSVFT
jgi:hypothetical protein